MSRGDRILATVHLSPRDRVQLAHTERLVLDITDLPEVAALRAERDALHLALADFVVDVEAVLREHREGAAASQVPESGR